MGKLVDLLHLHVEGGGVPAMKWPEGVLSVTCEVQVLLKAVFLLKEFHHTSEHIPNQIQGLINQIFGTFSGTYPIMSYLNLIDGVFTGETSQGKHTAPPSAHSVNTQLEAILVELMRCYTKQHVIVLSLDGITITDHERLNNQTLNSIQPTLITTTSLL